MDDFLRVYRILTMDCFAFPTIHERLRQLTTISAGPSMLFDHKRRSSLNIIEKNFVVRVLQLFSHNVPNHYEDHDETKFAFNFLQLERVFSAKPRLHAARRFHETPSPPIKATDLRRHKAIVTIKGLIQFSLAMYHILILTVAAFSRKDFEKHKFFTKKDLHSE